MKTFNAIRTLARSPYWQTIYSRSKEMGSVGLFENKAEFTPIQVTFLQWLEVYHTLEVDLAMKKDNVSREVIDDDIRCDAYLVWRDIIAGKSQEEVQKMQSLNEHTDGAVVFKTKRKK